ncbi:uncharacterized protein [Triticum aestivum]|uniref:uncharacterized protein n=1 Tax=Triticum aestivum TaxID=4565 RepID=UPI001D011644|nr:uncharacterized protein LOC123158529 [Triticum aestivum]
MAERPGKVVQQYNTEDGLVGGGCGGLMPGMRPASTRHDSLSLPHAAAGSPFPISPRVPRRGGCPPTAGFPPNEFPHSTPIAANKKKMPSSLTDIPDHLLAEIFLRLPDPADLARASAACLTFHRLATDRYFLRRFRCLHAPPLLGFLDRDGFHPALAPHPSAPAARALALAADFSFSFLPSHRLWTVQDSRDGRVLLQRGPEMGEVALIFRELAVCDPFHRWHLMLPPVPRDLVASVLR